LKHRIEKKYKNRKIIEIEVPCFSNPIGMVTMGKYMRRPLDGQRKNTGMLKGILEAKNNISFFNQPT